MEVSIWRIRKFKEVSSVNLIHFNRQFIFNKSFDIRISCRFRRGKDYGEQKLRKVKIWIEEILTLSKARRVITEIILLLKYQKQTITAMLMGKMALCCCYLLALEDRGCTKYFVIRNFTWLLIINVITD